LNRIVSYLTTMVLCLAAAASVSGQVYGTLERVNVFGPSLAGNLLDQPDAPEVSVYLPPGYAANPDRRYPVVYVLHGYSGTDAGWFGNDSRMKANLTADNVMGEGTSEEMILVMPNCNNMFNGCMYVNSAATGYWEDYIADDLVGYIDSHYRTIPDRMARGLAGHSMGGYGVLLIGMRRPDVFSALYAMSSCCLLNNAPSLEAVEVQNERMADDFEGYQAGTFDNVMQAQAAAWAPNPDNPPYYFDFPYQDGEELPLVSRKWTANSPLVFVDQYVPALKQYRGIFLDVGDEDGLEATNTQLSAAMTRLGIEHNYEIYEGNHGNRIGQRFIENVLSFFEEHLDQE